MRLERLESKILVWETGMQKNQLLYDSSENISSYRRRELSMIEDFLRKSKEIEEANTISAYMGKTLKYKVIPQLIPTGNYSINQPLSSLKRTIDRYVEEFDLQLDPDFQRAHVWNEKQRIAFVEFILQGGKTNPIYFNHNGWMKNWNGEMVIVDGKQRLTSLLMFLNNEFPVFKDLDGSGIGYYASEFDYFGFDAEVIVVINDLPTRKQVLEWYLQMNRGNVAHTEEELKIVEDLLVNENKG